MIFHDSTNIEFKQPFGAIRNGNTIRIKLNTSEEFHSVVIRLWKPTNTEGIIQMIYNEDEKNYEASFKINEIGNNWYFFIIQDKNMNLFYYGCREDYTAGEGKVYYNFPHEHSFQLTCYDKNFEVPKWFKEGRIMYQIFPDRFCRESIEESMQSAKYLDKFGILEGKGYKTIHANFREKIGHTIWGADNNEFYGGNLRGIINNLGYLKELNIGIIYLNPIFEARSNHRYDAANFMSIDPMLGTEDDFRELCNKCHDLDIKLVIDVSWNHSGDDSVYFNKFKTYGNGGAYNDKSSPYRDWYFIRHDNSYDGWWGFDSLPVLNKSCSSYREHVKKAIKYWNRLGIDGFRLDVIDELPDDFLEFFRGEVKRINPELCIFGEVWDDASLKKGPYGLRSYVHGKSQDSVMNYVLRNFIEEFISYAAKEKEINHIKPLTGSEFVKKYNNLISNYPEDVVNSSMNFLSTHDINRILTVFGECPPAYNMSMREKANVSLDNDYWKKDLAIKRFKLAWLMLVFLKGNPSLFYGDEIGMEGYNDPFNRRPMNWDMVLEKNDLLNFVIDSNILRARHDCLKNGNQTLYGDSDSVTIVRYNEEQRIILTVNRKTLEYLINFDRI